MMDEPEPVRIEDGSGGDGQRSKVDEGEEEGSGGDCRLGGKADS